MKYLRRRILGVGAWATCLSFVSSGWAASVTLTNATATFSQTELWTCPPGQMIDGVVEYQPGVHVGWSIGGGGEGKKQTAVFETATNLGVRSGGSFTFTIIQNANLNPHSALLGRFRFSVTASDRQTFADAAANNGDVTADWVLLYADSFATSNGTVLAEQKDYSLLATKVSPSLVDTFTVVARTDLTNITGIRLEALPDPSFSGGGPGTYLGGNFIISEFAVDFQEAPAPQE